jgi:hypothetical protein
MLGLRVVCAPARGYRRQAHHCGASQDVRRATQRPGTCLPLPAPLTHTRTSQSAHTHLSISIRLEPRLRTFHTSSSTTHSLVPILTPTPNSFLYLTQTGAGQREVGPAELVHYGHPAVDGVMELTGRQWGEQGHLQVRPLTSTLPPAACL